MWGLRPIPAIALTVASLLGACLASAAAFPAASIAYEVLEYPTGENDDLSSNIAVGPDGSVWWTSTAADKIGRLVPAEAAPGTSSGITYVSTDVGGDGPASYPQGIAVAPDGQVWFSESNGAGAGIDRLDPGDGTIHHMSSTTGGRALVFSPSGSLFLTTPADTVGELADPSEPGSISESAAVTYPYAWGIAADAAGNIWVGEDGRGATGRQGAIGEAAAGGLGLSEYLTPTTASEPQQLTVDNEGNVWFVERSANRIGELRPRDAVAGTSAGITEYPVPIPSGGSPEEEPEYITTAADGSIWFTEYSYASSRDNQVGRIVPTGPAAVSFTMTQVPGGGVPVGIGADRAGNVWFVGGSPTAVFEVPGVAAPGAGAGGSAGSETAQGSAGPGAASSAGTGAGTTTHVHAAGVVRSPAPKVKGTAVVQHLVCAGPPEDLCSVVFDLETRETYPNGGLIELKPRPAPAAVARSGNKHRHHKPRRVVVGHKTVTLHGGQGTTVRVTINRRGHKLLKRFHRLPARLSVTESVAGGRRRLVRSSKVTFRAKPKGRHLHRRRRGNAR